MIEIRKAGLADLDKLHPLGRDTFYHSFKDANTVEDMNNYLAANFTREKIEEQLTNRDSIFYLALDKDVAVGYLKLNRGPAQTDIQDDSSLEIERIYVKVGLQGSGIGQQLFETAVATAKENKAAYIWLGVWDQNTRAIKFYERHGFKEFAKHDFLLGSDLQTDILMRLDISD